MPYLASHIFIASRKGVALPLSEQGSFHLTKNAETSVE